MNENCITLAPLKSAALLEGTTDIYVAVDGILHAVISIGAPPCR